MPPNARVLVSVPMQRYTAIHMQYPLWCQELTFLSGSHRLETRLVLVCCRRLRSSMGVTVQLRTPYRIPTAPLLAALT